MVGRAGSSHIQFGSISGMLLGQFSAGRLGLHQAFGTGRGTGLGKLWSGQLTFFCSFLSLAKLSPFSFPPLSQPVLWVCPLPCLPDPPHALPALPRSWTWHVASV